jgi:hypothetical protein
VLIIICICYLWNQHDKQNNNNLHLDDERLRNENLQMKEALKVTMCEPCWGSTFSMEEHEHYKAQDAMGERRA